MVSNYSFLLRVALLHLVLFGLSQWPVISIASILLLEVLFVFFHTIRYLKKKHLKSLILFISTVGSSFFIIAIAITLLLKAKIISQKVDPLSPSSQ